MTGAPEFTNLETELLLLCSRTARDDAMAAKVQRLAHRPVSWKSLIVLARRHGTVPLIYSALQDLCPGAVPAQAMAELREECLHNAGRAAFQQQTLFRILDVFAAQRIPALPYKGPMLAMSLYGNVAMRPCDDLDILLRESGVRRAKDLLLAHGFQTFYGFTPAQEAAYFGSRNSYCYTVDLVLDRNRGSLKVELHWRIPAPFSLNMESLWERLESVTAEGRTVLQFAPEDLLLILSVHGFKHFWRCLKWVCDVAELLRHNEMDWDLVIRRAEAMGGRRVLLLGALTASELLGAPVPAAVVKLARTTPAVAGMYAQVRERIFRGEYLPVGVMNNFRVREKARDQARYCLELGRYCFIPDAQDRATLPLPAALSFLHYFIRPIRLPFRVARKYGVQLLSLPRHLIGR